MNVERKMSAKQLLSHHLSDYLILTDKLLVTLLNFQNDQSGGAVGREVMDKILRKDSLIQDAVTKLVEHQQFQQKIIGVQQEIGELDAKIISFARQLGDLEQKIHDVVTDEKTLKNLDGIITKQSFGVRDVTIFAEKLATMSFAPADYMEKKGMSATHQPPQTVESHMGVSMLHCSVEELLKVKAQNEEIDAWLRQKEETDRLDNDASVIVPPSFEQMSDVDETTKPEGWGPTFATSTKVAGASLRKGETLLSLDLGGDSSSSGSEDDEQEDNNNFSDDDFR